MNMGFQINWIDKIAAAYREVCNLWLPSQIHCRSFKRLCGYWMFKLYQLLYVDTFFHFFFRFIHDILHVSMPFSQIFPPFPSPTESIRLFYTSVSLLLSCIIQSEVSQKEKHQYSILTHIYGI